MQKFICVVGFAASIDAIPNCDNKTRLIAEYHAASDAYSKGISDLYDGVDRITLTKYERLKLLLLRRARKFAEARKNLDLHTYQHGC